MKTTITIALLLISQISLFAHEQITIKTKIFEGPSAIIVHDMNKLSKTKGVDALSAPQIQTESGKRGSVVIPGKEAPEIHAIQPFSDIASGVTIRIVSKIENGSISFRGQIVVREAVSEGKKHYEIKSREIYVSGTQKVGEESWFEFAEDEEGKKIAVCIKITKE